MSRQLIVNADDFGRSSGTSRGILHAHVAGIVTSTTVMINQPGVEAQLDEALACPELGLGIHLVFTAGQPVLPPEKIPSLVTADGVFWDQHTLWARAMAISLRELRAELSAQIERFATLAHRSPDHLDCHHFVYLCPPFFQVYADLGASFRLPLRVPFPLQTDFSAAASALPYLEGFPQDLVRGMVVTNSALVKSHRLSHPSNFVGTFYGEDALRLTSLLDLLDDLPEGSSELMCHPGYDDLTPADTSYRREREIELGLLTAPVVVRHIRELGIELVNFSALA